MEIKNQNIVGFEKTTLSLKIRKRINVKNAITKSSKGIMESQLNFALGLGKKDPAIFKNVSIKTLDIRQTS